MIRLLVNLIMLPFKIIFFPLTLIRRDVEGSISDVDKAFDKTKCPRCRSSNVYKMGRKKWHCNNCGRNFRR